MAKTAEVSELLAPLQLPGNLEIKLNALHRLIKHRFSVIERIGIALFDEELDLLRTYFYSAEQPSPLTHYYARLSDCDSLNQVRLSGRPRIIDDMEAVAKSGKKHARLLSESGYRSSYTLPMIFDGQFLGFVFFDAVKKGAFTARKSVELNMLAEMLTLMIFNERSNIRTLKATLKSALDITRDRDPETAEHLERMSRFSLLIAQQLAEQYDFDDQKVDHIFQFSTLHDLGKIRVADAILLKRGALNAEERKEMNNHPRYGVALLERLLENHGLKGLADIDILNNIVLYHHERFDGSGYPCQLSAQLIPIEARIIAVADVFDALTSVRPYKKAWSNAAAFDYLTQQAGVLFDPDCIHALCQNQAEIAVIQQRFQENAFG